ncbi:MAG TPA: hypothetical protein VF334_18305 [Polyangia bacterium]
MTPIHAFGAVAATWQNFYLLVGTAAATLMGLMFVAVTFGAGLMRAESLASARAFIDPPFTHFVTVLLLACLMLVPTMNGGILGAVLLAVTLLRGVALVGVGRRMREAHSRYGDIELSDWMLAILLPVVCYAGLAAAGAAFLLDRAAAFAGMAAVVVVIMLLGIFAAWELIIWLATTRVQTKAAPEA